MLFFLFIRSSSIFCFASRLDYAWLFIFNFMFFFNYLDFANYPGKSSSVVEFFIFLFEWLLNWLRERLLLPIDDELLRRELESLLLYGLFYSEPFAPSERVLPPS